MYSKVCNEHKSSCKRIEKIKHDRINRITLKSYDAEIKQTMYTRYTSCDYTRDDNVNVAKVRLHCDVYELIEALSVSEKIRLIRFDRSNKP